MARSTVYTWVGVIFLSLLGLFSMYMIGKGTDCVGQDCTKYTLMGWFGLVAMIGLIIYLAMRDRKPKKIPWPVIQKKYIEYMESEKQISISPTCFQFHLTEEGTRYIWVLRHNVDSIPHYYVGEADFFTGDFGRGVGTWFTKEADAEHWHACRKKVDIRQALAGEMTRQAMKGMVLQGKMQEAQIAKINSDQKTGEFR